MYLGVTANGVARTIHLKDAVILKALLRRIRRMRPHRHGTIHMISFHGPETSASMSGIPSSPGALQGLLQGIFGVEIILQGQRCANAESLQPCQWEAEFAPHLQRSLNGR